MVQCKTLLRLRLQQKAPRHTRLKKWNKHEHKIFLLFFLDITNGSYVTDDCKNKILWQYFGFPKKNSFCTAAATFQTCTGTLRIHRAACRRSVSTWVQLQRWCLVLWSINCLVQFVLLTCLTSWWKRSTQQSWLTCNYTLTAWLKTLDC